MGRNYPSPQPTGDSEGASWAPPVGSGAEPWRKTNLVHSKRHRTLLVARYCKYYEKCKIIIIFNFPLISIKPFVVFLVVFALIRFLWLKLPWRYLLFIVTYSYVGIARNWSHKRRTSPQRPKNCGRKPKTKVDFLGRSLSPGHSPGSKRFFFAWKPP